MKRYALISVSDKARVEALARGLEELGYTILSTSGTASYLRNHCSEVIDVSGVTGFPEILEGRIKTLHPFIHAAILADRDKPDHMETLASLAIERIDLVAVNLYPFLASSLKPGAQHKEIIEQIDIGGPSLLRAAAKNHAGVVALCDPDNYQMVLDQLRDASEVALNTRISLARKAFKHVAAYDAEIAGYFLSREHPTPLAEELPGQLQISSPLKQVLRYGENPHQQAGLYTNGSSGLALLHGIELSYNNHLDIDSTLRSLQLFDLPTVVITKHCNPCGIGCADSLAEAYRKAFAADTESPFGGIIGVNRPLDLETAQLINQVFTEIIIAPEYEEGVLDFLGKKKNRRLIRFEPSLMEQTQNPWELKHLLHGWLLQSFDQVEKDTQTWQTVTKRHPSPDELQALRFGWKVASLLRSNAIALTGPDRVYGLGAGQTSRIDALHLAVWKAQKFGHDLSAAVCASDGFFPFRDSIDEIHARGIRTIIQPGGSKGDAEVIAACDSCGIAMVFTGYRHFRH